MDFRFVHAADIHLDSPFKGLDLEPSVRELVQGATFAALSRIVDLCIQERAAFLVLSGDLFDAKDRSVRARLHLAAELARLGAAGIRAFIVHGNHDPLGDLRPGAGLPASVKVFGAEWEEVTVERDGQVLCRVQGISYAQEKVTENLALRFRRQGEGFTVAALHANLGGDASHHDYAPCTLMDLAGRGLDYWALGHVHTQAVHPLPGGGVAVYPGNCQGRHIHEDGPRGCAVVDVKDGRAQVRFAPVDVVRWHKVEVDVAQIATVEDLTDAVVDQLAQRSEVEGPKAHAARIWLVGRGPVHPELSRPGALEQLEDAWRQTLAQRRPAWALESVRDETRPQLDPQALIAAGGLSGAVMQLSSLAQAAPELVDDLWAEEDLKKLEAALRRHKLPSPRAEGPSLVEEAALAVAERLWEDGP